MIQDVLGADQRFSLSCTQPASMHLRWRHSRSGSCGHCGQSACRAKEGGAVGMGCRRVHSKGADDTHQSKHKSNRTKPTTSMTHSPNVRKSDKASEFLRDFFSHEGPRARGSKKIITFNSTFCRNILLTEVNFLWAPDF